MDFVNKLAGGSSSADKQQKIPNEQEPKGSGGIMGRLSNMGGGGAQGEKDEDMLDKGVDLVQEKLLGQGPQNNESAAEQAKDEAISDTIRNQYKKATGKEFPVADKDKSYGRF